MRLLNVIWYLYLGASVALATGQEPRDFSQARDLYFQQVKDTAEALKGYNGGLAAGISLISEIYATRKTVGVLTAYTKTVEQYSAADSALISNDTVETAGDLIDLLNVGVLKIPYAQKIGQVARVKSLVEQAYREDLYLLEDIYLRLLPDDQQRVEEGFNQVRHAYEALLKATS